MAKTGDSTSYSAAYAIVHAKNNPEKRSTGIRCVSNLFAFISNFIYPLKKPMPKHFNKSDLSTLML